MAKAPHCHCQFYEHTKNTLSILFILVFVKNSLQLEANRFQADANLRACVQLVAFCICLNYLIEQLLINNDLIYRIRIKQDHNLTNLPVSKTDSAESMGQRSVWCHVT